MIDFSISLICKCKQYKNVIVVNFVYYGKTRISERPTLKSFCEPSVKSVRVDMIGRF